MWPTNLTKSIKHTNKPGLPIHMQGHGKPPAV